MAGLEKVPLRIPSQWDPVWFEKFVRDFLSLADVRNAIPGTGITITGNSDTNATLSSSGPPGTIANAEYTLLALEPDLPNARLLKGTPGVIDLNDAGAGDTLTIGLVHGGVDDVFLTQRAALSVMGRPQDTVGTAGDIISAGDKSVLHQSGTALAFDTIDSSYVSDFVEAAQDAVGAALTNTATIHLTYTDASNEITADVQASATLDVVGSTRGDILYRGASGWAVLAPGSAGKVLQTGGAGADPSWATASGGGGNVTPDSHPSSANAMDDEFESGSSVNTGLWTWRNQGSATGAVGQGALQLAAPAASGDNLHIVEQTLPAGACRFRSKFTVIESADFAAGGMVLVNSSNGKCMVFGMAHNSGLGNDLIVVYKYTNVTTFSSSASANANNATLYGGLYSPRYFEIEIDGSANLIFRVSASGYDGTFSQVFTEAASTFLGTPDKIGLTVSPNNVSLSLQTTADWFRRMA